MTTCTFSLGHKHDDRPSRIAPRTIAGAVCTFVVLVGLAMRSYPGGTAWDPTTHGHDFWFNYLCDLSRKTALNGAPNALGSALTQAALLVLGAGALQFWWALPSLFPARSKLGCAVRVLGSMSFVGMLLAALLPPDRYGDLHPFLLAVAGGPGLAAGTCSVIGLAQRERVSAFLGVCGVVTCAVDFGLYAQQIASNGPGPVAVVVMERVALLCILAWMSMVAWRMRKVAFA